MHATFMLICLVLLHHTCYGQLQGHKASTRRRLGSYIGIRRRLTAQRQNTPLISMNTREICFDMVGCFKSSTHAALKKFPEAPDVIATRFLLFSHLNPSTSQLIAYGDNLESLRDSNFTTKLPLKVIIHGYKGSASDASAIIGVQKLLKLMDANVILVDWTKGASGPSYPTAVANTELVGRQLALLLLDMLSLGYPANHIHLIGFSLGAHVAACASHILQTKNIKIGRITGLDPASPIYKHNKLLERSRKLDTDDADFVDVIHTDGSAVWTNGFGLLQPVGHVDFFPNGGKEQPGCNDGRASLVVSHFEGTVNSSVVCSHVRAWRLFLETLTRRENGCQFLAYPCLEGHRRFQEMDCFPSVDSCHDHKVCGEMGINADKAPGRGALFLVTRETSPYCGKQLKATVVISEKTSRTRGILQMNLLYKSTSTNFRMHNEFADIVQGGQSLRSVAAADYDSVNVEMVTNITTVVHYQTLSFYNSEMGNKQDESKHQSSVPVYIDRVTISDLFGNSWHYCGKDTLLNPNSQSVFSEVKIQLTSESCRL